MTADLQREVRMITFLLGTESFLLDIMSLQQIVPYEGSTAIPRAPDFVEGVIVLRDSVIPIIDLRSRLYPQLGKADSAPLVLITQIDGQTVGLKVDEVRRIVNVSVDRLLPPPDMVAAGPRELVVAVAEIKGEVFLLLDLEVLLSRSEKDDLRGSMAATDAASVRALTPHA
jgi:purine-binding chemotaxis protein CheW